MSKECQRSPTVLLTGQVGTLQGAAGWHRARQADGPAERWKGVTQGAWWSRQGTAARVLEPAVLPGLPGQRDALIQLHQRDVVVVELRYVPVPQSSSVVSGMHHHLPGIGDARLWKT